MNTSLPAAIIIARNSKQDALRPNIDQSGYINRRRGKSRHLGAFCDYRGAHVNSRNQIHGGGRPCSGLHIVPSGRLGYLTA